MILAHELVHAGNAGNPAYHLNPSEPLVMAIANQIAQEMNAATGSTYDTTRDSHEGPGAFLYDFVYLQNFRYCASRM